MLDVEETIVAIASPTSPAVRGIVRLSGADVETVLKRLRAAPPPASPTSGRARRYTTAVDGGDPLGRIPVDVLLWPHRQSYTGQPSAELHTFGCLPLLQALVQAVIEAGARAARPGEFTLRAFLAGRLDLTQAEAVLGVIEAEEQQALDHALGQLAGNLSRPLDRLRNEMLDLLADVEAGLDFVDEDIEFIADADLVDRLSVIAGALTDTAKQMQVRSGGAMRTTIVLRGLPNAGKSRLANALAEREVAIVADVPGTTRDSVTADLNIGRHPVKLIDTAGLETAQATVDRLSQQQAARVSTQASLRIWCVDFSRDDFQRICEQLPTQSDRLSGCIDLCVATKMDLRPAQHPPTGWIGTSATSGQGIEGLKRAIAAAIETFDRQETGSVAGTAARCGQSIARAKSAIDAAVELTQTHQGHELVASELRTAVEQLGEVTGAVYTDDILDRVFGRFCIGK
ncbi:MAG: tRNA modification GTPase [Pirellulales bacterium]|nr:tRNA modification GTPase [Pirellulales bacterium]